MLSGDALSFDKERFATTAKLLTNISPPRVKVVFNHRSMEKVRALCEACDIEIGALGLVDEKVIPDGTRVFKIYDIFVPEQECSPTVTKITPDGFFKLFHELAAIYGIKKAVAIKDRLYWWWHSHVNFGTGPSGQDEREFTEQGTGRSKIFMSIGNKQGDLHCNLKMKLPELADWAQWEIRDVEWTKEWETVVSIKDEVHPLLLEEGQKPYRVRTFTDSSAGEIVRDPKIYEWAQQQVETKVKGLNSGYFSRYSTSNRSALVMPDELAGVKVEEYQINAEEDLETFVLELWGEKPPKPVPVAPLTPVQTPVTTTVTEGEAAAKVETTTEVVAPEPVTVEDMENDWWLDLTKMRKWWPKQLTFKYYDQMMIEVSWPLALILGVWMLIVIIIKIIGWAIFTLAYKIIRLILWDWYAVPIGWAARGISKWNEGRAEERKYRKEKKESSERRVAPRIKTTESSNGKRQSDASGSEGKE